MEKIVAVRLGNVSESVEPGAATQEDRVLPEAEGGTRMWKRSSTSLRPASAVQSARVLRVKVTRDRLARASCNALRKRSTASPKDAGLTVAPLPMELIEDIPYEPNLWANRELYTTEKLISKIKLVSKTFPTGTNRCTGTVRCIFFSRTELR